MATGALDSSGSTQHSCSSLSIEDADDELVLMKFKLREISDSHLDILVHKAEFAGGAKSQTSQRRSGMLFNGSELVRPDQKLKKKAQELQSQHIRGMLRWKLRGKESASVGNGFNPTFTSCSIEIVSCNDGVDVFRGVHWLTGQFRCIKRVEANSADRLARLEKESSILRHIAHENILAFSESWCELGSHFFEFEWCIGGKVVDYIWHDPDSQSRSLSISALEKLLVDISTALQWLHGSDRNLAHGGIGTNDILVDFKVMSHSFRFAHHSEANMDKARLSLYEALETGHVRNLVFKLRGFENASHLGKENQHMIEKDWATFGETMCCLSCGRSEPSWNSSMELDVSCVPISIRAVVQRMMCLTATNQPSLEALLNEARGSSATWM